MKALILAAGVSRRLYPYTYSTPKCLLKVGGKPIIDYQLEAIKNLNIKKIIMIIGMNQQHLKKIIIELIPYTKVRVNKIRFLNKTQLMGLEDG